MKKILVSMLFALVSVCTFSQQANYFYTPMNLNAFSNVKGNGNIVEDTVVSTTKDTLAGLSFYSAKGDTTRDTVIVGNWFTNNVGVNKVHPNKFYIQGYVYTNDTTAILKFSLYTSTAKGKTVSYTFHAINNNKWVAFQINVPNAYVSTRVQPTFYYTVFTRIVGGTGKKVSFNNLRLYAN